MHKKTIFKFDVK